MKTPKAVRLFSRVAPDHIQIPMYYYTTEYFVPDVLCRSITGQGWKCPSDMPTLVAAWTP